MRHPPPLDDGDRIAVVSPAGPVTEEILAPGLDHLRRWGFDVEVGPNVYDRHDRRGYLAGPDADRIDAVQSVLERDDVGAVVFSRGGYGTMRLLPELDLSPLVDDPKLLVGFSDLTALHLYVAGLAEVATLHGPVVKSLRLHDPASPSSRALREALVGARAEPLEIDGLETVRGGCASGPLLGGNLSVLINVLGTPYAPDLDGVVLLVEETGESDYRLDRMLTSLRLRAERDSPAALVFGDFVDCEGVYVGEESVDDYVRALGDEFDCPAVAGAPVGHTDPNIALPMGVRTEVDADEGILRVASDATSKSD